MQVTVLSDFHLLRNAHIGCAIEMSPSRRLVLLLYVALTWNEHRPVHKVTRALFPVLMVYIK